MSKCVDGSQPIDITKHKNYLPLAKGTLQMRIDGEHDTVSIERLTVQTRRQESNLFFCISRENLVSTLKWRSVNDWFSDNCPYRVHFVFRFAPFWKLSLNVQCETYCPKHFRLYFSARFVFNKSVFISSKNMVCVTYKLQQQKIRGFSESNKWLFG